MHLDVYRALNSERALENRAMLYGSPALGVAFAIENKKRARAHDLDIN